MRPILRRHGSVLLVISAFACAKSVETPVAAVSAPTSANVGSVVQLDGTTSLDPQGRTLAYDWAMLELPAGSSAKLNDAHIATPSFVADVAGMYRLQLVVSNSFVSSAPMEVKVNVNSCGANPPVVQSTHASPSGPNPGQNVSLSAPISDPDLACVPNIPNQVWTYSWTMTSRPAGSSAFIGTPSGTLTSLSNPATADFIPDVPGAYTFRITATDVTQRESAPAFLTVTATSCGFGVPSVSLATSSISGTPGVQSTLPAAIVSDPDSSSGCGLSQTYSYLWTLISRPAASSATLLSPASAAPTFTPDHGGDYSFRVMVTDSTGLTSAPAFVTLTATACDQAAPSITSISATAAVIGTPVALGAQVSDANCLATARTFAWSLSSRPAGSSAALSDPTAAAPQFTPDVAGDYQVSLTVRNDQGFSSATAVTTLTAAPCTSTPAFGNPAVSAHDLDNAQQVDVGDRVVLSSSVIQGNACGSIPLTPFSYSWQLVSKPQGSQSALSSATDAQPIFVPDLQGSYRFSVVVADRLGNTTPTALLTLTTSSCGANPILADFNDAPGVRPFDPHQLTATASSADDDAARCPARFSQTYSASWTVISSAPNVGHLFQNASASSTAFSPGGNGTFDVQLTVTGSNSGRTAVVHKQIAVTCMNLAPVITGLSIAGNTPGFPAGEIFRDDVATLFAQATSECFSAPVFSYFWTLTPPAGSASALNSAFASTPSFSVDQPAATWTATVFVRDALGTASAVATQAFTSQSCGINPVSVAVNAIPGAKPFDTVDLSAVARSADDNASVCPGRFRNSAYAFTWSVISPPTSNSAFGTATTAGNASTNTFMAGDNGAWQIRAQAIGATSNATGAGSTTLSVLCNDTPVLGAIAAAGAISPHIGDNGGDFNRGDNIALSVPVDVSSCYSAAASAGLQYAWSMTGATLAAIPRPTFTVTQASASYAPSVTVADKWGHAANAGPAAFASSSCGQSAVSIHTPLSDTFAGKDFDTHTIVAVASSNDDNTALCPVSFANSGYSYVFSLVNSPTLKSSLSGSGATATLALGDSPATYTLRTTATGITSGVQSTAVDTHFTTSCSPTPVVAKPVVASGAGTVHAGGDFNRGDTITLSAPADVSACYSSAATAALAWSWSLTPASSDNAPFPTLLNATSATPSFTVDQPSRIYVAAATTTDKWGHASAPASTTFTSSNCGNNPISAIISNVPGALPMDASTLTATASTVDGDPLSCPASFAPKFAYVWTVSPNDGSSFSDPAAESTSFTPKAPTQYTATVVVSAQAPATSPASGPASTPVNAACPSPSVGPIDFTDTTNPGTTYFNGDSITASASVTSNCKSAPTFTYAWTVNSVSAGTAAMQTFKAAGFNTGYTAQLDVTDDSAQTGSNTGSLTTSGCGQFPPVVSFVSATQHFDAINQQRPTDGNPSPQTLDLAASATSPEAQFTIGTDRFPVPFYLATQVSATVRVDDATNGACASGYELKGAKLLDPNNNEVSGGDFTTPANGTIASGGTLDFTFTPRTGDIAIPQPIPGNYTLVATFVYGAPSGQAQSDVAANSIHVGGGCGLNAPSADAVLLPLSPSAVNDPITADATASSDADNEPLIFMTGPNASTGCGLDQTLAFAWSLLAVPNGSFTGLTTPTGKTTSFTPDSAGDYTLQLVVSDGTAATAPSSTATFTQTAQ